MRALFRFAAILLLAAAPGSALAQDSADDQVAVWAMIEEIWSAQESGATDWVDAMLSGDFMGWPSGSPAPRNKASTRMWSKFDTEQRKGLAHELYPLSIVVHGDMAVVHYLYTLVEQTKDRQVVRTNGRYTDVLVRDGSDWKFISWHGGADND
ncbi:MAG: nuclear transport factor 2 family protein [Gammaproteobacteria bacterium]|nr:nuclear transport factor 2 family protein [Gammaproteobacteria bacterium]MDH5345576.1 nuclear transport factor 2 family protein [Gammaproteobacteria bacterium]